MTTSTTIRMKNLRDIPSMNNARVLLRADFNVPIRAGEVVDDFRIRAAIPTIEYLRTLGARVIIVSHLEVKKGEDDTLSPVSRRLSDLGIPNTFVADLADVPRLTADLPSGACLLIDNLRRYPGEKANDAGFAAALASLADIYVNDAFSVSHREHASVVGVPALIPSYAGLQLEREVAALSKAFDPEHPFLFVLGGAKFSTKIPLLSRFTQIADQIFVGGALANDIFRAKGYETGRSLLSAGALDLGRFLQDSKLLIPTDITNDKHEIKKPDALNPGDKIMDAGPATLEMLRKAALSARFILWNGPLGMYEDGYCEPTNELARIIASATARGAVTIVGGGDTLAAIAALDIEDQFTFVSTAGGAMLDYLSHETLPGIQALAVSLHVS